MRAFRRQVFLVVLLASMAVIFAACTKASTGPKTGSKTGTNGAPVNLNGAGSTFVFPLFSKLFDEYHNVQPNVTVNYQSIGSGAGIQQITAKTVEFGATDGPMTDDQLKAAPGAILHIPVTMGAEAITYNIPGVKTGLKFTGDVLANIFLGKIKKWNDSAITSLNPGINLPASDIVVVHRSDGSGTTYIFADYLSSVSPEWSTKVGKATSVNWPVGLGGKGNEGVSGQISQTPGAIGYVELAYAVQNNLTYGVLKNKSGNYEKPSIAGTTASADGIRLPADLRVSLVNSPNPDAYPITGFSWALVYQNQTDKAKGKATVDLFTWVIHDGQKFSKALNYAPLPDTVVKADEGKLKSVKVGG